MNAHCDVLVVGGGPAGLAAAWAAGNAGARVILADEQSEFGGSLLSHRDVAAVAADPASDGVDRRRDARWRGWRGPSRGSRRCPKCALLPRSTVFGYHDHNFLTIAERLHRSSAAGRAQGAARARVARAREAGGAGDRRHRAPAGLRATTIGPA